MTPAVSVNAIDDDWDGISYRRSNKLPVRGLTDVIFLTEWTGLPAIAAFSSKPPMWSDDTIQNVTELMSLPENWDHQGAQAVSEEIACFSVNLLFELLDWRSPAPQVIPLAYGGLQFEWHQKGVDLELEFTAPDEVFASFEDHLTGKEFDKLLRTDYRILIEPIMLITNR